jgi:hypothetical protein
MSLTVVCWRWKPALGYRSKFEAEHVNIWARMIRRNYSGPMQLVCITDDPVGITEVDRIIPLWDEFADIHSPHDSTRGPKRNPSCYRRLRMFSDWAVENIGKRIISIDLDIVVTGDLTPIFERTEDIVLWGDTNPTTRYNGSLILHTAGRFTDVYEEFKKDPKACIARGTALRQFGSDQAWLGAKLGPNRAKYGTSDGVYSFRVHLDKGRNPLPDNARLISFHGNLDPFGDWAQKLKWVRESYR